MAWETQNLTQHSSLQYPNLHFGTFCHCWSLCMPWSPPKWCLSFRLSNWAVRISSSFFMYVLHAPTLLTYQELIIQLSGDKYRLWSSSLHSSLVPHKTTSLYRQQITFLTVSNSGVLGVDHPPHLKPRLKKEHSYTCSSSEPSLPVIGWTLSSLLGQSVWTMSTTFSFLHFFFFLEIWSISVIMWNQNYRFLLLTFTVTETNSF